MNGDRENEFCFEIANDSNGNRFYAEDVKYKKTDVEIQSVLDNTLFPDRLKIHLRRIKTFLSTNFIINFCMLWLVE